MSRGTMHIDIKMAMSWSFEHQTHIQASVNAYILHANSNGLFLWQIDLLCAWHLSAVSNNCDIMLYMAADYLCQDTSITPFV